MNKFYHKRWNKLADRDYAFTHNEYENRITLAINRTVKEALQNGADIKVILEFLIKYNRL